MAPPGYPWRRAVVVLVMGMVGCTTASPPPTTAVAPAAEPPRLALPTASVELRPIPSSGRHLVEPGETLSEIAFMYGLGTQALAWANDLEDPDDLLWGTRLRLRWSYPTEIAALPPRRGGDGFGFGPVEPLRVVFVAMPPASDEGDAEGPLSVTFSEPTIAPPAAATAAQPFGP